MFKKIPVVLALGLLLTITGCGIFSSATEKYMNALNKTQNASDMQVQTQNTITMDLSKAGEETKQDLDKFKNITINTDQRIDNKNKQAETHNFVKIGELLLDSQVFVDQEKVYLKASFTGDNYLDLTSQAQQNSNNPTISEEKLTKFTEDLQEIWKSSVQQEILSKEGSSIENTPDGDIKVSILTLELNDEKSKTILKKIAELVANNDAMLASMAQDGTVYMPCNLTEDSQKQQIQDWLHKLPQTLENNKDKFAIEKLKLTAKIDKDSHIIDETMEGTLLIKSDGELRINFNAHTTRWNINSGKVKVTIPQITKDNLLDVTDMKSSDSEMIEQFKEYFNK